MTLNIRIIIICVRKSNVRYNVFLFRKMSDLPLPL